MEDVIKLKMAGNFCLLLGPGLQTPTFLKVKVVETGNNETNPQKHLAQGIFPIQSVDAYEELKIQRKIPQLRATKQPQHVSQRKETIIHTTQRAQSHNGQPDI